MNKDKHYYSDQLREVKMDEACSTHEKGEKFT